MPDTESNIVIYNTLNDKSAVALYAVEMKIGLNQMLTSKLSATSRQNINNYRHNSLKKRK